MASVHLPSPLTGLLFRVGHDVPVRNAAEELDLARHRAEAAAELSRRVEARVDEKHRADDRRTPGHRPARAG